MLRDWGPRAAEGVRGGLRRGGPGTRRKGRLGSHEAASLVVEPNARPAASDNASGLVALVVEVSWLLFGSVRVGARRSARPKRQPHFLQRLRFPLCCQSPLL